MLVCSVFGCCTRITTRLVVVCAWISCEFVVGGGYVVCGLLISLCCVWVLVLFGCGCLALWVCLLCVAGLLVYFGLAAAFCCLFVLLLFGGWC